MTPLARDLARIARWAPASDAAGALQPAQRAVLERRGWLRLYLPAGTGGPQMALPEALPLLEAIAAADGSCGWMTTLCAGASWFAGFLPGTLALSLAATPRLCLAGSGAPLGRAEPDAGGWRVAGAWPFASGAPWATHFTLNAVLPGGAVRAFVVPAEAVQRTSPWKAMGLRASGTQGFLIEGAWVPASHAFEIRPEAATQPGALYRFPFEAFAYVTLAATLSGMARHFTALALPLAVARVPGLAWPQALVQAMDAARRACLDEVGRAWAALEAGAAVDAQQAQQLRLQALAWGEACRDAVDRLYPLCGLRAADPAEALHRAWRDFHTGSQHSLLLPA